MNASSLQRGETPSCCHTPKKASSPNDQQNSTQLSQTRCAKTDNITPPFHVIAHAYKPLHVTLKACPLHTPNQIRLHKQSTSEDGFQAWPPLVLVRSLRTRDAQPVQKESSSRLLSLFHLHRTPRIHNQASFSTPSTPSPSSTSASTEDRKSVV